MATNGLAVKGQSVTAASLPERGKTFRNAAMFARQGYWISAALRLRCAVIGHRFDCDPSLLHCDRCGWVQLPNP